MSFTLNGSDVEKVKGYISEIVNSNIRISSEQELIKEIAEEAKEKFQINPSVLKKAAKLSLDSQKKMKEDEVFEEVDYLVALVKEKINVNGINNL